jgi:hypothetical protein
MLSGVGSLLSGLSGSRPILLPQTYLGYTPIYCMPYVVEANHKSDGTFGTSARDRKTGAMVFENTMEGLTRVNSHLNYMIFTGDFYDRSNHMFGNLIAELKDTLGVAENVVIGDDIDQSLSYSWSGLSHVNMNYLWLSTVEDSDSNSGFRSSRYLRDLTPEASIDGNPPSGAKSVLVGTFMSGIGFNDFSDGSVFVQVVDHAEDSLNPHSTLINQQYLVTSGLDVLTKQFWPYAQVSGAPTIMSRTSIEFWNDLTILSNSRVITSGASVNTWSGVLTQSTPLNNFVGTNLVVGFLDITSGLSTSGCNFRQDVSVTSGVRFNGQALRDFIPLVSGKVLSGTGVAHIHSITDLAEGDQSVWPKYPGVVASSYPANTTYDSLSYNQSLESSPTLFRYGNSVWVWVTGTGWVLKTTPDMSLYIRNWMPKGYTQLDKIEVHHRLAKASPSSSFGYPRVTAAIVDALGTTIVPHQGQALHIVSGINNFMIISGIDQSNLAPDNPWDLKLTLANLYSGSAVMLGEVRVYYKSARE